MSSQEVESGKAKIWSPGSAGDHDGIFQGSGMANAI